MKHLMIATAFAVASTAAFGSENKDYTFDFVVASGQTIDGYQLTTFTPPAINNINSIIFGANSTISIEPSVSFFAGLFSPQTHITSYTAPSDTPCLAPYAINDENQIAFVMDNKLSPSEPFVSGVYETTYTGGTVQTIVAPGSVVDGVTLLGSFCGQENGNNFAFDNKGRIAFNDSGGSYRYVPGKGVKKINPDQGDGRTIGAVTNDSAGELVFQGDIGTSSLPGGNAIFTRNETLVQVPEKIEGVNVTSISETQVSRGGQFVFLGAIGAQSANKWGLFTRDQVVARSGQTIDGKFISNAGEPFSGIPAINSKGEVAFEANTGKGSNPQGTSIFIDDKVLVSVGDTLSGRVVTGLSDPVMNDSGVIAFLASFSDGTQAIIEATKRYR
jgi:hypothetical protein